MNFFDNLITSSKIILGVFLSSTITSMTLCWYNNTTFINPEYSQEKIVSRLKETFFYTGTVIVTTIPLVSWIFLDKLDTIPHSYSENVCNISEYVVLVEFIFYVIHYYQHRNKCLYRSIHKLHHENTSVYPFDTYYIGVIDAMCINSALLLPLYIIKLNYSELILVNYFYVTSAYLVHSDFFCNHHLLHHTYRNCNYCFVFPIFDVAFGTCKK